VDAGVIAQHPAAHDGTALAKMGGTTLYTAGGRDGCLLRWPDGGESEPERLGCVPGGVVAINTMGDERVYVGGPRSVLGFDHGREVTAGPYVGLRRIGVDARGERVFVSTASGGVDVLDTGLAPRAHLEVGEPMGFASGLASGVAIGLTERGAIIDLDGPAFLGRYVPLVPPCGTRPTRSSFATEADRFVAGCQNGRLVTWPDVPGIERLVHPQAILDVDASSDGQVLVAGSRTGVLTVIDLDADVTRSASANAGLVNVEYLPNQRAVVAITQEPSMFVIWEVASIGPPYPLGDADVYHWLHPDEGDEVGRADSR
jgi:hypothetical protein